MQLTSKRPQWQRAGELTEVGLGNGGLMPLSVEKVRSKDHRDGVSSFEGLVGELIEGGPQDTEWAVPCSAVFGLAANLKMGHLHVAASFGTLEASRCRCSEKHVAGYLNRDASLFQGPCALSLPPEPYRVPEHVSSTRLSCPFHISSAFLLPSRSPPHPLVKQASITV